MMIRTNQELAQAVNEAIKESGYKKNWIADQLGIQKESFARALNEATLIWADNDSYWNCSTFTI